MSNNSQTDLGPYQLTEGSSLMAAVQKLIVEAHETGTRNHPSYLGKGSSWQAFELEHEGKNLVVKISNGVSHTPEATIESARKLVGGTNIPAVEQLNALDATRGILITSRVPGKRLVDLTREELEAIPDSHYTDLLKNMKIAVKAGVSFDPRPTNYLYDPKAGFGFVDYSTEDPKPEHTKEFFESMEGAAAGFAIALQNVGYYDHPKQTPEEMARAIEAIESGIAASEKFLEVAAKHGELIPPTSFLGLRETVSVQTSNMNATMDFYKTQLGIQQPAAEPPGAWWAR